MRVIFITTTAPRRPMPKTKRAKAKQAPHSDGSAPDASLIPSAPLPAPQPQKGKNPRLGARPNQITSPWLDKVRCL